MKEEKRNWCRWIPALLVMGTIFMFSAQDAPHSEQSSGIICTLIEKALAFFFTFSSEKQMMLSQQLSFFIRKGAHMSIYFLLGVSIIYAFGSFEFKQMRKRILYSISLGVLYSISDEFHQSFTPGRSPEFRDVCIDSLGVILGVLLCSLILNKIKKRKEEINDCKKSKKRGIRTD